MDRKPFFPHVIDDPHTTPNGLLVPGKSIEYLVKAEARRIQQEKEKSAFFSRYAMYNNMSAFGAREKPVGTPSFEILREAAKKSFIDAILIRARIDQTKRVWQKSMGGKSVGFKVVHDRDADPDFKGSKEIDDRCREMEALLSDPTPVKFLNIYPHNIRPHTNLKDLQAYLTKAELVIDRKVIRRYKRADKQGYAAFHWLPGETIKNVDESVRQWAQENEPDKKVGRHSIEKMSYATGYDIARCAYLQMFDGQISAGFTEDEVSVHISNPSDEPNRFGYGESRLELSLDVTATLLYAWNYNKELFKTNWPDSIVSVSGDFDAEGFAAFKQQLTAQVGQGGWNRMPFINGNAGGDKDSFKLEAQKLRDSPKDMLFDQLIRMMVMFKAAAYGAHPSTLNLTMDSGGGGSSLFGHSPSEEIEFSKEHGLIPQLTDSCEWLTDALVKPRYDDLRLVLTGLDPDDEKTSVEVRASRVGKWITKNEGRMEEGKEPLGFWVAPSEYKGLSEEKKTEYDSNPWNYPADVAMPNYLNTFNMINNGGAEVDAEGQPKGKQPESPVEAQPRVKGKPTKPADEGMEKSQQLPLRFLQMTLED